MAWGCVTSEGCGLGMCHLRGVWPGDASPRRGVAGGCVTSEGCGLGMRHLGGVWPEDEADIL